MTKRKKQNQKTTTKNNTKLHKKQKQNTIADLKKKTKKFLACILCVFGVFFM